MPSSITHEIIAAEALKHLPASARTMVEGATDYYYFGSQGGDPLFFYKPLFSKEYNFGKFVHRHAVYGLFCAMRDYLKTLSGDGLVKACAYCLGYITHYSADVCFHPFVYRYLKRDKKGGKSLHMRIENDWDVYFSRTHKGVEAERYAYPFSPAKIAEEGVLFPLFSFIAQRLGRKPLKKSAFDGALKNYERYLKFFHGDCYKHARRSEKIEALFRSRRLSSFYPNETPSPAVLGGEEFYALAGGKAKDADELFELSAQDGARRIVLFLAALDGATLPRNEFNLHLLTGEATPDANPT